MKTEREFVLEILREIKSGYDKPGAEYNSALYLKLDLAIQWLQYGVPFSLDQDNDNEALRILRGEKLQ